MRWPVVAVWEIPRHATVDVCLTRQSLGLHLPLRSSSNHFAVKRQFIIAAVLKPARGAPPFFPSVVIKMPLTAGQACTACGETGDLIQCKKCVERMADKGVSAAICKPCLRDPEKVADVGR